MLKKENLRKNFLRVKQIADQNLGRAEKTEALTDDLAQIEKRIELIKTVSLNTHKKISGCLQATGVDVEKRLKKIPVTALSCSMIESSTLLGESLIGTLFQICGDMEGSLGKEVLTHELEVESNVLTPLQNITENDIPNIMKLKKQLNRLVLDMDSARARYHQSLRQSTIPGKENKTDLIKDELEDASMKVEQCRDALATEMYQFFSQETEYGKIALSYAEAQARYHRHSLEVLESVLPKLRSEITQYAHKPVYGTSLEDHLQSTEREIAVVLEECVCTLIDVGLEEEGLFRVAGGASKVKKLKAALDAGVVDLDEFIRDPHVVAGALKLYFRELPEPLMTYSLYSEWMQAAKLPNDQRLQALWTVADQLPKYNYNNLRYLIKFLNKLAEHSDTNKMSSSNIAIVMGPNLIWSEKDGGPNMLTTGTQSAIIDTFITHADWFFPGEIEFSSEPMCMSHSFTGGSSPCMGQRSSLNNSPVSGSPSLAPRSPSDHNVPAVAAAIDSPSGGKRSPKLNRRVTKTKKGLAPPPPQIQHSSDQHTSVPNSSTDSGSDLETTSTSPDRPVSDHLDRPVPPANKPCYSPRTSYTETNPPPIPERPSQPPPGPPVAHAPPSVVPHPALPISPKERKGSTGGGHRPTRPGPPPPPPPRSDEQKPEIDEETKL
ncbi:rho GTPase-activating protein 17-like [Tubulanus polymorphus]|uniref:rho GTPase-activating protein 17-like n=1 Tax=Tubulanus polymorphus TaxID=672921 RepID=UPI003DA2287F